MRRVRALGFPCVYSRGNRGRKLLQAWPSTRKGCMKASQDAGTHFGVRIRQTVECPPKTSRPKSTKGPCVSPSAVASEGVTVAAAPVAQAASESTAAFQKAGYSSLLESHVKKPVKKASDYCLAGVERAAHSTAAACRQPSKTRGFARSCTPRDVEVSARLQADHPNGAGTGGVLIARSSNPILALALGQASNVHYGSVALSPLSSPADGLSMPEAQA